LDLLEQDLLGGRIFVAPDLVLTQAEIVCAFAGVTKHDSKNAESRKDSVKHPT